MSEPLTLKGVYTGASEEGPRLVGLRIEGERSVLRWLAVEDDERFEEWRGRFSPGDGVVCSVEVDERRQVLKLIEMRPG